MSEPFSGMNVFDGLTEGNTTFLSGTTGGYTFNASGTGNAADFSAATSGVTIDLSTSPAAVSGFASGGQDAMTGITSVTGAAAGQNSFVAGAASETFAQTGSGTGDRIDFSAVATSSSSPLTINVSGALLSGLANDSASVGATTYSFAAGGAAFTVFTGATDGNTTFLASGLGGYSFTAGGGGNNAIDFSAASSGVNVNLSPSTEGGVPSGEANVPGGVDVINGLTTVVGAPGGDNTFAAGSTGPYTFTSSGTGNRFLAGTGDATFIDAASGNTVDFSALSTPVIVNVSGVEVGTTLNDTATAGAATDTFSGLGLPSTFIGATSGGTTFDAGAAGNTFVGHGLTADSLSYAFAPGGSLLVCAAGLSTGPCSGVPAGSTGKAVLGSATEPFAGIKVFDGLTAGITTFVSGATGGYTFNATGSGNAADFSAATSAAPGVTIDLSTTPATVSGFARGGPDAMTGITSVTGSAAGQNTFRAGSSNESFAQTAPGIGDAIDFSRAATSPSTALTVNVSGGPAGGGLANDSASVGATTYTFSAGGGAFTRFTGATAGNTNFLANAAGGYAFKSSRVPEYPCSVGVSCGDDGGCESKFRRESGGRASSQCRRRRKEVRHVQRYPVFRGARGIRFLGPGPADNAGTRDGGRDVFASAHRGRRCGTVSRLDRREWLTAARTNPLGEWCLVRHPDRNWNVFVRRDLGRRTQHTGRDSNHAGGQIGQRYGLRSASHSATYVIGPERPLAPLAPDGRDSSSTIPRRHEACCRRVSGIRRHRR